MLLQEAPVNRQACGAATIHKVRGRHVLTCVQPTLCREGRPYERGCLLLFFCKIGARERFSKRWDALMRGYLNDLTQEMVT